MLHAGLLAGGPVGWAAFAVFTAALILGAGSSGMFDQNEIDKDDYDDDGICVPYYPHPDPHVDPDDTVPELTYPWGFVFVTPSAPEGNDDPDDIPDDIRPPSSSFAMAAEPYDSEAGVLIAALMSFLMVFFGLRAFTEGEA